MVNSIMNMNTNLLEPFHLISYYMIANRNQQVACSSQAQATQFDQRTNTMSGLGDLAYAVLKFPVEGFFEGQLKEGVQNQIWDAIFALWQGWNLTRSQTCKEVGFQFGRIYQALINFNVPDQILFSSVSA